MAREGEPKSSEKNSFEDDIEKIDKELRQACDCKDENIMKMTMCEGRVKKIKELKSTQNLEQDLGTYRNKLGDTVAHTLVTHHNAPWALKDLLCLSPRLATEPRIYHMEGQTILHIAVCTKKYSMVRAILQHLTDNDRGGKFKLLTATAVGDRFKKTVMLGQLPLSVAALTLDKEMVKLLLMEGADIRGTNSEGDTVFHSLIRYAAVHINCRGEILDMMQYLYDKHCQPYLTMIREPSTPYIWHMTNNSFMTPLQLAASLGLPNIFEGILNLENTYKYHTKRDGLFHNIYLYDVTEIDTTSQAEWERFPPDAPTESKPGEKAWNEPGHSPALSHKSMAVLEILCQLKSCEAYPFLVIGAIRELVEQKWNNYKKWVLSWGILHFVMMTLITAHAVSKTKVITSETYPDRDAGQGDKIFAITIAVLHSIYAISLLFAECYRLVVLKYKYFDVNYRLMLVIFSPALLVDTIWFFAKPDSNYFLIIALIMGWSFMGFFLRTFRLFSFYTVMFLELLSGDMFRIAILIFCQFIAFSVALYSTFLNADSDEGFEDFGRALITVFNLMLGLKDVQTLNDAREPWMAILLYIIFVLSTYVLLLNSLIAVMALMCEEITKHRDQEWNLQRLLVLLLIETMVYKSSRYLPSSKAIRRYGKPVQEYRSYVEVEVRSLCATNKTSGQGPNLEMKG